MSYSSSFNSNNYTYADTVKTPTFNNDYIRQRKLSVFEAKNTKYQTTKNDNDTSSFLRSTMGSYKSKPNRQMFESAARQTQKKPDFNLRHTTGNLSAIFKKIDFESEYKPDNPLTSKKYADLNTNQGGFKKQKTSSNLYESKPVSKYEYSDSKNEVSSKKNIDEILSKLKREKQLDAQIKKLKEQKQLKAKASKVFSSLSNLLGAQNFTSYSTYSPKQTYNKNPQDSYSKYRKANQTVGETYKAVDSDKKHDYDFSKKPKLDYTSHTPKKQYQFDKKYKDFSKKYDTTVKKQKQYDWKKSNTDSSSSFLTRENKASTNQTAAKISNSYSDSKSPIKTTKKEDTFSQYFSSSGQQKGQKFDCKVTIKDFKLGKSLGQGKFGNVYQAIHKPSNSLFALKKVPKSIIKSHYMIDQFILELKLQTFMNHENLLAMHGFFHDTDHIYLILDYMEQGTLYSMLKKNKKLQMNDAAKKIKEITKGIIYMHQNGIAHRDIKPQNVVMSNGSSKLCDFGWSTICDQRRKTYCGTFDYAAPEILQGSQYDMSVDLWCLGVLAYQLLVGKAPFYHIKKQQTKKKIINVQSQPIKFPSELSKESIDFIERLLKKDPQDRIKIEDLLNHPFLSKA